MVTKGQPLPARPYVPRRLRAVVETSRLELGSRAQVMSNVPSQGILQYRVRDGRRYRTSRSYVLIAYLAAEDTESSEASSGEEGDISSGEGEDGMEEYGQSGWPTAPGVQHMQP